MLNAFSNGGISSYYVFIDYNILEKKLEIFSENIKIFRKFSTNIKNSPVYLVLNSSRPNKYKFFHWIPFVH